MSDKPCNRAVIMFRPPFAEMVKTGKKLQTIRAESKRVIGPGTILDLREWMGKPYYSKQRKLGTGVCTGVERILIGEKLYAWFRCDIAYNTNDIDALDEVAQADGFDSWMHLAKWFAERYGLPFTGVHYKWKLTPEKP